MLLLFCQVSLFHAGCGNPHGSPVGAASRVHGGTLGTVYYNQHNITPGMNFPDDFLDNRRGTVFYFLLLICYVRSILPLPPSRNSDRGHMAGALTPSPIRFVPCVDRENNSAFSPLVHSRRILQTHRPLIGAFCILFRRENSALTGLESIPVVTRSNHHTTGSAEGKQNEKGDLGKMSTTTMTAYFHMHIAWRLLLSSLTRKPAWRIVRGGV